jgi:hypothetical protein
MTRLAAAICLSIAVVGGSVAGAEESPWPAQPSLTISTRTLDLGRFSVSSQACGRISPVNPGFGCVFADGAINPHVPLKRRVKAAFRGTVTVTVPESTTDNVFISYGRQPETSYPAQPAIVWPLPGSGTYYMFVTVKWHTTLATGDTTYAVPLYVPRQP